ncbi:MAG: M24 family metallopeptidase [Rhizobiaceae bacterium]
MSDLFASRRARLTDIIREAGLGAVAIVPGPNFYYLSGLHFHLMERPTLLIVLASGEIAGIIPELERLKWSHTFPDAQTFYWQDKDGFAGAFAQASENLGSLSIGIEGQRMRAFEAEVLRAHFGDDAISDAHDALSGLRLSKDRTEIEATQKAINISEAALAETIDHVRAGMSEREIAGILKIRILANGADGLAFDPIVLAGGNSANPHGVSGGTQLMAGDPLLIDFGAQYAGYNADITRTFFCGHPKGDHAEIYQTVLEANEKGCSVAGPELTAHELDEAVTGVLAQSRFADLIVHKTGHGLGLDVHEAPQVMTGNRAQLVEGALVTIEPGLYRTGEIGVRIEDDVLMEAGGCRSLTSFPRELTVVGG